MAKKQEIFVKTNLIGCINELKLNHLNQYIVYSLRGMCNHETITNFHIIAS